MFKPSMTGGHKRSYFLKNLHLKVYCFSKIQMTFCDHQALKGLNIFASDLKYWMDVKVSVVEKIFACGKFLWS